VGSPGFQPPYRRFSRVWLSILAHKLARLSALIHALRSDGGSSLGGAASHMPGNENAPVWRYTGNAMRVSVREISTGQWDVFVLLTKEEAAGVSRALHSHLDGAPGHRGPGYHLHLEATNGSELTIGVLEPEPR
jgi:hypothetical protein